MEGTKRVRIGLRNGVLSSHEEQLCENYYNGQH